MTCHVRIAGNDNIFILRSVIVWRVDCIAQFCVEWTTPRQNYQKGVLCEQNHPRLLGCDVKAKKSNFFTLLSTNQIAEIVCPLGNRTLCDECGGASARSTICVNSERLHRHKGECGREVQWVQALSAHGQHGEDSCLIRITRLSVPPTKLLRTFVLGISKETKTKQNWHKHIRKFVVTPNSCESRSSHETPWNSAQPLHENIMWWELDFMKVVVHQ